MLKPLVVALTAALIAAASAPSASWAAASISGAGATAPAPIYAKWAEAYRAQTGTSLNYQAIGSGGGIKQIEAKTVQFGASDKPLKPDQLGPLFQFPTVVLGVVPVVNLPGVQPGQLKLTGPVLADIFLGKIRRWGDAPIANLNKGLRLPNLPITVVHRSDGSGTSFLYTTYLAAKSPEWAQKVGANDAVQWPVGQGGKGNDGVSAFVRQTPGSIGYVEYTYARANKLEHVSLANRQNQFVQPTAQSFSAAAAHADWAHAPGYYQLLIDQPGAGVWPISGATFILVQKNQENAANGAEVLKFFDWAYRSGDAMAQQLDYIPLPAAVKAQVRKGWATQVKAGGKPVYISR